MYFRIKTRVYGLLTSKWFQMTSKDLWWLTETSETFFKEHGYGAYQLEVEILKNDQPKNISQCTF